jgi:hypothetical protein
MRARRSDLWTAAIICAAAFSCAAARAEPEMRYLANPQFTEKLPPKADASLVEVLDSRSPRAQVLIGKLAVKGGPGISQDDLVRFARSKAADLGADFVYRTGDADVTTRTSGPSGSAGFGSVQNRGARTIVSSAPVLGFSLGVFAKATLGIEYMDFHVTWGRPVVKGFRSASKASSAGVEIGDEIVELDGIPAFGDDERRIKWIIAAVPDQVASVRLKRGDSTLVVNVPLVAND